MSKKRKSIEAYYCPGGGFYTLMADGEWVKTDKETIRLKLVRAGFANTGDAVSISSASAALLEIIERRTIHFAGALAGQPTGLVEIGGNRILVTKAARSVAPKPGRLTLIEQLIAQQFGEATDYLLTWLKAARERLLRGGGPMLPALIISGEAGTAKSFLQNHIVTPLIGGRADKPMRYWTGATHFNENLCGVEHLILEDEKFIFNKEKRAAFGDALKQAVASELTSLHPKGGRAFPVKCVWAISCSTNLEPQNLRMYPFHDASMNDKLLVLRCVKRPDCLPDPNDYAARLKFERDVHAEIFALAAFLDRYQPPKHCRASGRSAVTPWRDPEIMELVSDDDGVPKLIWLIDDLKLLGDGLQMERTCTSMELERELLQADKNFQGRRLLEKSSLAYLLREAAKRFPERIEKCGESHGGLTRWKVRPA